MPKKKSWLTLGMWGPSLVIWAGLLPICAASAADPQQGEAAIVPRDQAGAAGLYVEVRLTKPMKASALRPGDILEGKLVRDVYARDRKVFPAGSTIRLVVDSLEKRKREHDDHWPGVIALFAPRHRTFPVFRSATVSLAGGDIPLHVSLISVTRPVEVHAPSKSKGSDAPAVSPPATQEGGAETPAVATAAPAEAKQAKGTKRASGQTLIFEAAEPEALSEALPEPLPASHSPVASAGTTGSPVTLAAGTQAQIVLLAPLSASKSRPGDSFHARLVEPVRSGAKIILPAGSLFDGRVVRSRPPRWLSRPGSLYLALTELTLPGGIRVPVAAQLTGAEADQRSHLRLGAEGELSGGHPGKAWMLINLGVTAGVSKEADDSFQLIIEALVSTATDASTAGTARIVAACASSIFMATRHGRDVVLPRFTELDVAFSRPLSLAQVPPADGSQPRDEDALQAGQHK